MSVYISKTFSTPEEFEAWIAKQEHGNKDFLDKLCEKDKENWDKKACKMTVKDGKLQLLCEDGNVLAEENYYQPDEDTVCCDEEAGKITVKGIMNANDPTGKKFRVWVGTQAEYDAIKVKDPRMLYYITDDTTLEDILTSINDIISGKTIVGHAQKADTADTAGYATNAGHASTADNATNAGHATNADNATNADYAEKAYDATKAELATKAGWASYVKANAIDVGYNSSSAQITQTGTYLINIQFGEYGVNQNKMSLIMVVSTFSSQAISPRLFLPTGEYCYVEYDGNGTLSINNGNSKEYYGTFIIYSLRRIAN